jgi:hypothetical protein
MPNIDYPRVIEEDPQELEKLEKQIVPGGEQVAS